MDDPRSLAVNHGVGSAWRRGTLQTPAFHHGAARFRRRAVRTFHEQLRAIVETLKRALYGARSEKQDEPPAQLPLALGDLSPIAAEPAKLPSPANTNRPPRPKPARNIGQN